MKSSRRALVVLALAMVVLTAWAGENAVVNNSRSDKTDQAPAVQAQSPDEDKKSDQATQSRPTENQPPRSGDQEVRPQQRRSDQAQSPGSGQNTDPSYESGRETVRTAPSPQRSERSYSQPTQVDAERYNRESGDAGEINIPRTGGEPSRRRGGDGYRGGHDDPFHRRPTYYHGGRPRRGPHDHWRYRHYHDSWRFLFYLGPVIYYPPIHYPHVIRIPRERIGVYVRYTGDDAVGSAFANSVREQLRDQGLRVVYSQDNARLELYIISMERDADDPGYNSAISVSYVWYPGHRFITAQMVDAGINEVDDLAASVAAYADDLIDQYR
jgi:hypothetical protein